MKEVEWRNGDEGFRVLEKGNCKGMAIFTVLVTLNGQREEDNVKCVIYMSHSLN